MVVRNYDEILGNLIDYTIANQDKVTDFNEGGVLRTQYEAFARLLERFYIDVRNGFSANLQQMAYSIFDFKRKEGVKATVQVVFSRTKANSGEVTIPVGTKISDGTHLFITSEIAVIKSKQTDSNKVVAVAEKKGLKYNVEANTITIIDSIVNSEVEKVTNPLQATGGTDKETEVQTMERFKIFINGLQGTNSYGLKGAVLGVEGVKSCSLQEHFPPLEDNVNVSIYVDDGSGASISKELETKILDIINGTDVESNPGKRASGINVDVKSASALPINVDVNVTVRRTDEQIAKADIRKALEEAVNNLKVGEDVVLTSLLIKIRRISYVTDVSKITINKHEGNEAIGIDQVAKLGTLEIVVRNE